MDANQVKNPVQYIRGDRPVTNANAEETYDALNKYGQDIADLAEVEEIRRADRLKEVKLSDGKIILFIDERHLILGAGQMSGAMDVANLLNLMLARGELRCIGVTLDEYRQHLEKEKVFERRFQQVLVKMLSVPDAVGILRGLKERYESHHSVQILGAAIIATASLADKYIKERFMPAKTIDIIDEACANVRVELDCQPEVIFDELECRQLQLQVETTALAKEKDAISKQRIKKVQEGLTNIQDELKLLILCHRVEKGATKRDYTHPK
ncbi:hypothetical protein BBO99_00009146 [Phytophthora kernoviae]|uniref:ClpA/ClpB AAA lid domain-containing protein n=2 Tax=Phytophthora kernoviae TaxID=325452 RepID=A0A3R7KPI0_9STRA|nr:hypothetical protein G195_011606 [Phytophthora kernoviae 00238/432]RLN02790.1 hypothetical protein BBI17_009166 [Phytophthora kernoviae]RLN73983.1 hypothetical protein BBO99_00009146 [Phytophthora kernoviae]